MIGLNRRARRLRPAPPSERLYEDVTWAEPRDVKLPLWRRTLSILELVVVVAVLGVVLTITIGVALVMAFFLLDMLVG